MLCRPGGHANVSPFGIPPPGADNNPGGASGRLYCLVPTKLVALKLPQRCAGAMIMSRLGTLVYGAREEHTGSAASVLNLFEENYPGHTAIYSGILAGESSALLRDFFEKMRK